MVDRLALLIVVIILKCSVDLIIKQCYFWKLLVNSTMKSANSTSLGQSSTELKNQLQC